jgi:glucan biosynthesis protein C
MVKLGIVSIIGVGVMLALAAGHPQAGSPADFPYYATYNLLWSLNIWCWCMAVMALGIRHLNRDNAVVRYASESALPFYVIHHPVVVILGSFIVGWSLPLWIRFLLLVVCAFSVTLTIYEFGVRRTNVTRFIFGLRPLARKAAVPAQPGRTATAT